MSATLKKILQMGICYNIVTFYCRYFKYWFVAFFFTALYYSYLPTVGNEAEVLHIHSKWFLHLKIRWMATPSRSLSWYI